MVSFAFNLNVPAAPTVTATVSNNAAPPLTVNVPPFTAVAPLNVFVPLNVNSPAPAFVNPNAPETTPLATTSLAVVNVRSDVSAPAPVKVNLPVFTASPIETEPPNSYALPIVRSPPPPPVAAVLATVEPAILSSPDTSPNAALFPTQTAPAFNVAPPLKVFAPLNVNDPAPTLVNETAPPPTIPCKTTSLAVVNVVFEFNVPSPVNVNVPFLVESPSVTAPPNEYAFAMDFAVVPSLETVDPTIAKGPVPNA
jgi:hypothetical protein